jgi:hypothetical protein
MGAADSIQRFIAQPSRLFRGDAAEDRACEFSMLCGIACELPGFGGKRRALR